ncbi:MAG: transpeptidase family protein [Candidatus Zixiibacteriota bacterium]|nr:MAG: transpeptidase family protein [candidate division Zixibacteria bacterium]
MTDFRTLRRRGRLIRAVFIIIGLVFLARSVEVQIFKHNTFKEYADSQQKSSMLLKSKRGSILDCRNRLLAYDMEVKSYSVNPGYMKNSGQEALKLSRLTGKSKSYWIKKFKKHPGFLYITRGVSQKDQSRYEDAGIETLKSRVETVRIYPYKDLASEVIGRTDTDNCGVSGLEMYYEDILAGSDGQSIYLRDVYGNEVTNWEHTIVEPMDGSDICLTLDLDFQQIVEEELRWMLDSSKALYGSAVFMDLETGGVAACATIEKGKVSFQRCRGIVDRNEPGSTAKIIPLAAVFREGIFEPNDIINVEGGRFNLGRHVIRDDHPYDTLRCDEIGIHSSNIGVSKMGLAAGSDLIYKMLLRFGFGEKTGVDFPGEISGLIHKPEKWTEHFLANVCFGYGVAVSGLQTVRAYAAIANGGELLRPFFAEKMISPEGSEKTLNAKVVERNILDKRTRDILNDIFYGVVREGTARRADDRLCAIAGKTGTALRIKKEGHGYDPHRSLASFVGYFPADNPRYAGIVMYDEPRTSIYGGEVSAPVFRKIARRFVSLPRNSALVKGGIENQQEESRLTRISHGDFGTSPKAETRYASVKDVFAANNPESMLPDFRGKTIRDAYRAARSLGLKCAIYGSGIVEYQKPAPGIIIDRVDELILYGK